MEFLDIVESVKKRNEDEEEMETAHWYRLIGKGDVPSPRVGHSSVWINRPYSNCRQYSGNIFCVGGANPDGSFQEIYDLDLSQSFWKGCKSLGLETRYEHAAYTFGEPTTSCKIGIFGGANEKGNLNSVQEYDVINETWTSIQPECDLDLLPTPRTHHTSVVLDNKLVIFGGGEHSAMPVQDEKVYLYDQVAKTWTQPEIKGVPPKPRQGHVMIAVLNKIYIHGGMCGTEFFDDLYKLDLDAGLWTVVHPNSPYPDARAGHGGIGLDNNFIIFGGLTKEGVTDDLYLFHTGTQIWTKVSVRGDIPKPRLDFAITKIAVTATENDDNVAELAFYLMFLHGGMNVEGDVFDDTYICHIKIEG